MYSVTKRIDFCYGHRLLDHDGKCRHPHGHNAVVEIEVRSDTLDSRNMVRDFSEIKGAVKDWIDTELDHRMLLRHDDPLVAALQQLSALRPALLPGPALPSADQRASYRPAWTGRLSLAPAQQRKARSAKEHSLRP